MSNLNVHTIFFTFAYKFMVEKVLFLNQILETEYLKNLHVLKSPESENNIFRGWPVCTHVYVSVISITEKQMTVETSKFVFYICVIFNCYLKIFPEIEKKFCVQERTKDSNTLQPMNGISC